MKTFIFLVFALFTPFLCFGQFQVTVKVALEPVPGLTYPNGPIPPFLDAQDWVTVQLRNTKDPTQVVEESVGLIMRNDSVAFLNFSVSNTVSYFVSVLHRNSLGVMTATPTTSGGVVDFTTNENVYFKNPFYEGHQQKEIDGKFFLWAGDANQDGQVIYQGQDNDYDVLRNTVLGDPDNVFKSLTFQSFGYKPTDLNMDGKTIVAGQDNDVDLLINNTLLNPLNIFRSMTFVLVAQLP